MTAGMVIQITHRLLHALVEAADGSGCEWFIVEQDKGFDDPFAAIATSLRYLERLAS